MNWQSILRRIITIAVGYVGIDAAKHDQLIGAIVSGLGIIAVQAWSEFQMSQEKRKVSESTETEILRRAGKVPLWIGFIVLAMPFIGCVSHSNKRYDAETGHVIEIDRAKAFFSKTAVQNLKASTTDTTKTNGQHSYSRRLGIDAATSEVDSQGLAAMESLLGKLLIEGLKKGTAPAIP